MLTHSFWWLIVDALAVYRLVQLIGRDAITARGRDVVQKRSQAAFLFITCPWCVGLWIAAGAVALTRFVPSAWQYAALALALSGIAGFLAER